MIYAGGFYEALLSQKLHLSVTGASVLSFIARGQYLIW